MQQIALPVTNLDFFAAVYFVCKNETDEVSVAVLSNSPHTKELPEAFWSIANFTQFELRKPSSPNDNKLDAYPCLASGYNFGDSVYLNADLITLQQLYRLLSPSYAYKSRTDNFFTQTRPKAPVPVASFKAVKLIHAESGECEYFGEDWIHTEEDQIYSKYENWPIQIAGKVSQRAKVLRSPLSNNQIALLIQDFHYDLVRHDLLKAFKSDEKTPQPKGTGFVIDRTEEATPMLDNYQNTKGMKFDGGKVRWSLLPSTISPVLDVLEFGAQKYQPDNWQHVPDAKTRYFNAAMRHIWAWWHGEIKDPESGSHHLAHAVCCLLFAMWFDDQEGKK